MASSVLVLVLILSLQSINASLDSGVVKLIVKTYLDDILSGDQDMSNRRLYQLGDHISRHPALHQRRLFVGDDPPPNLDPDKMRNGKVRLADSIHKRSDVERPLTGDMTIPPAQPSPGFGSAELFGLSASTPTPTGDVDGATHASDPPSSTPLTNLPAKSQFPSEEICTTDRQWEQINETNDFYDNKVSIVQEEGLQQFVFTYRCSNARGACTGISPFYHSECTERFGWIYMYYRKSDSDQPQWGYVAAPHHCACKIQPNAGEDEGSTARKRASRGHPLRHYKTFRTIPVRG